MTERVRVLLVGLDRSLEKQLDDGFEVSSVETLDAVPDPGMQTPWSLASMKGSRWRRYEHYGARLPTRLSWWSPIPTTPPKAPSRCTQAPRTT